MGPGARRDAVRWVLAYTLAVLGDVTYYLILTWAAAEAGGARWSGIILAAGSLPRLLLILAGGVLADRLDPRRIAIWTDSARAATLVVAVLLTAVLGLLPWWLTVVAVIFGVVDACFLPAVGAMPARLVPPEELTRLQAWRITGLRVANAAGPVLGALLLVGGSAVAFGAVALLFVASVILLRTIRPVAAGARGTRAASAKSGSGWREVRRLRITTLVIGTALSELPFSGPIAAAIILLVQGRGWPASIAGGVLAAFSVGGLATSVLLSMTTRAGGRTMTLASVGATALLLIAFGSSTDPGAAFLWGATLGITSGVTMVLCQGQVQRATPPALLGRVTAVLTLLTLGLSPLAYAGVGLVADLAGVPTLFTAAAVVVAASGVVLATARFETPAPPAPAEG